MTKDEFKAWFEGFSECIAKAPTEKQWKRIKEQVAAITGTPITERVFIERYNHFYREYRPYLGAQPQVTWAVQGNSYGYANPTFNGISAMLAAGKYEAAAN